MAIDQSAALRFIFLHFLRFNVTDLGKNSLIFRRRQLLAKKFKAKYQHFGLILFFQT